MAGKEAEGGASAATASPVAASAEAEAAMQAAFDKAMNQQRERQQQQQQQQQQEGVDDDAIFASVPPNDIEVPATEEEEAAAPAGEGGAPAVVDEPDTKAAKAAAKAAQKAAAKAEKAAAKEKAKADKGAAKVRAQEEKARAKAAKEAAKVTAKSSQSAPPATPEPQAAAASATAVAGAEAPENADVESPVAAVGVAAGIAAAVAEAAAGGAPAGAPAEAAAGEGEDEGDGKGDGKGEGDAGSAAGKADGDEDGEERPKDDDDFVVKVFITPAAPGSKRGISRQGSIYIPCCGGKRIKCAVKLGRKAAKCCLVATNCLFFALALGLIGIGGFALGSTWGKFFDLGVLVGCIVVGVFLSMVAFFGCVGAVTLRRRYLVNYIALTTVIFAAQVIQTLFTWKLMKTVTTTQDQGFDEETYDASQRAVVGTIRSVIGSAFGGGGCAVVPAAASSSPALSVACSDAGSGWFVDFVGANCNTPTSSATFQKCNATAVGGTAAAKEAYDPVYCACRGALFDQLAKYATHISAISVSLCVFEFLLVCAALRLALSKKGKARAEQDKALVEERRERRASLKSERAAVQTEKKAAAAERKERISQLALEAKLASAAQAVRIKDPPANAGDEPPYASASYAAAHAANAAKDASAAAAAAAVTQEVAATPAGVSADADAGAGAIVDLNSAKVQV